MKCRCCISLRSAVYFGASVHIFLGILLFAIFFMHTTVFVYRYFTLGQNEEVDTSLTLLPFLSMLVDATFLPLGCLIFRGAEKESVNLVKWPGILYFVAKLVEMGLKIYHGFETPAKKQDDWEPFMYQGIDVVSTSIYLFILFLYTRKLGRVINRSDYFHTPTEHSLTMNSSKLLSNIE